MNKQISWEILTKLKSSREQEDQWRQHSPQVKVSEVAGEDSFPRYLDVVLTRAEISTECERHSEQGPHAKEETPAQPPAVPGVETLRLDCIQILTHKAFQEIVY